MNKYCVVTTINSPTKAIEKLHEHFGENLIVIGDKKTPDNWEYKDVNYLSLEQQGYLGFLITYYTPENSYARKNFGYLEAIKNKAEIIYETDDDSIPNDNWKIRMQLVEANVSDEQRWFNIYKVFSNHYVWPRGFSLRHINDEVTIGAVQFLISSIQQGMIDDDPDVDAIWRMTMQGLPIKFTDTNSVFIHPNTWCPFNSQNTFWFPKAYPLMYLPVYVNFRMCDIWRSFIAQRCLWEIGDGVTFHSPSEVYQDRNEHDLLADFKDEIPGYLHNDEIVEILSALTLKQGEENMCSNLLTCYQALVDKNILPTKEIFSVKAWIKDYERIIKA